MLHVTLEDELEKNLLLRFVQSCLDASCLDSDCIDLLTSLDSFVFDTNHDELVKAESQNRLELDQTFVKALDVGLPLFTELMNVKTFEIVFIFLSVLR